MDLFIHSLGLARIGILGDGSTVVPMAGQLECAEGAGSSGGDQPLTSGGLEGEGTGFPRSSLETAVTDIHCSVWSSWMLLCIPAATFSSSQSSSAVHFNSPETQAYRLIFNHTQSRKSAHLELISTFIRHHPFSSVLFLTSLDISTAAEDESVIMSPWRALLPPTAANSTNVMIEKLKEIPPYVQEPAYDPLREGGPSKTADIAYPPPLPAGGLCESLLADLQKEGQGTVPPHGTLCAWCAEGDNRGDAFGMAGVVAFVLGIGEWRKRKRILVFIS